MLFSVLIPVYNTAQYLDVCVQSVLRQTETDYEILLLDDGSTDNCPAICDSYAKRYSNIRVIHKENEGLMMTRRRGFKEAKGEYFICLDSDDYLLSENALRNIREMIEKKSCDLVLYNYVAGKENKNDDKVVTLFDFPNGHVFTDENKHILYEAFLMGKGLNAIWIKAASRSIVDIDTDYLPWKKNICRAEDRFQSYPMLNNAKRVGYIKKPFVYYRWTASSISNNPKLKYYNAFRTIYRREEEYLEKWALAEDVIINIKARRIPQILGIITTGFYSANNKKALDEWKAFVQKIAEDDFFEQMFVEVPRQKILGYYRIIGNLICRKHISFLILVLRLYKWYSKNIRHRKG